MVIGCEEEEAPNRQEIAHVGRGSAVRVLHRAGAPLPAIMRQSRSSRHLSPATAARSFPDPSGYTRRANGSGLAEGDAPAPASPSTGPYVQTLCSVAPAARDQRDVRKAVGVASAEPPRSSSPPLHLLGASLATNDERARSAATPCEFFKDGTIAALFDPAPSKRIAAATSTDTSLVVAPSGHTLGIGGFFVLPRRSWLLGIALSLASGPASAAISIPSNQWVKQAPPSVAKLAGFAGSFQARGWNHMLYDPVGRRMVLYDGYLDASRPYSIYANAIWTYDPVGNRLSLQKVSNWARISGKTVALSANSTDPTPFDRHSYSCIALVPEKNRL